MTTQRITSVSELTRKQAFEQTATAQLMLWNARLQSGWLQRKAARMEHRAEIFARLEQAWHSLERFKLMSEHDDVIHDLWRDVEESMGGVRQAVSAIRTRP